MNPLVQKLQSAYRHKKAASNFHHLNYHFNEQTQKQTQNNVYSNLHKKAKSLSKDFYHSQEGHTEHNKEVTGNKGKKNEQLIGSQILKQHRKNKNDKKLKEKKQDFIREYIKSESHPKKTKKKTIIELKPAKSSPQNRSHSKSAKKLRNSKQQKIPKSKQQCKQRKPQSKQVSRQKVSKDSKTSKSSRNKKGEGLNINKFQHKKTIQNNLSRQKKGSEINFRKISLKDKQLTNQIYPITPEQLVEKFRNYFSDSEINEMKQYKWIYFLGRQFQDSQKNGFNSARQRVIQQNEPDSVIQTKKQQYFETQNIAHNHPVSQQSEDTSQFYKYTIGSHIAYRYEIISSINRGSFGQVLKVYDHKTKEFLAIKVVKKSKQLVQQTFVQISILTHVKENDKASTSGIVRIKDFLLFRNHICIVFELLDGNLYELLTANNFKSFSEDVIRLFAVQILNSLNFLKREKIIHCDLKPQNLVMKNWGKSGIKLIDFGTSCFEGKQLYSYLQSRYYRAPEVIMQMPYSFPIDMWSFGCIIAELKLGEPLFSGRSSIQQLVYICASIGTPNKNDGLFSLAYLENEMMKQVIENDYFNSFGQNRLSLDQDSFFENHKQKLKTECLLSLQQRLSKKGALNPHFLDFLENIIKWQPGKRMTPEDALRHPWITKGLSSEMYSLYSSFHTTESCSKSKKTSKDSRKQSSNQKKSKPHSQNSKKLRKNDAIKDCIYNQKKNEENKINFGIKNSVQEKEYFQESQQVKHVKDRLGAMGSFLKKDSQNTNKVR